MTIDLDGIGDSKRGLIPYGITDYMAVDGIQISI